MSYSKREKISPKGILEKDVEAIKNSTFKEFFRWATHYKPELIQQLPWHTFKEAGYNAHKAIVKRNRFFGLEPGPEGESPECPSKVEEETLSTSEAG